MYILKNAFKSISRSKGRNILIGIIVAVIATASCVSLSIRNAANEAETQGMNQLNVTATISLDRQKVMSSVTNGSQDDMRKLLQKYTGLSLADMQKYAKSSYVKDFNYSLSSSMSASGSLMPYSENTAASSNTTSTTSANGQQGAKDNVNHSGFGRMGKQGDFIITGYNSESAMTTFVNGTSQVTSGKLFNMNAADSTCIISKELAAFNGINVGDKITLANPNKTDETYVFTVTGIYTNSESGSTTSGAMRFSTSQDPANQIYTSYGSLKAATTASSANAVTSTDSSTGEVTTTALREQTSGTYVFENTAALENFKSDVTKMGLDSNYTVTSYDETNYEQSLVPLKNLSKFAATLLIIVLLIGAVILVIFNIFNIRERKFEVGVLTAIGMKKGKVALQFISELFIVTFIALIIGTAAGSVISVPTANTMLQSQITLQKSEAQQQDTNFGRQGSQSGMQFRGNSMFGVFGRNSQSTNYLSTIDAVTNLHVVGELMGIGILLTILSSCAATTFVMRYEPLKILSNRT